MSWKKLDRKQLYPLLARFDKDIAGKIHQKGCPHCGGTLHRGDYKRQPRGLPDGVEWTRRISYCCAREGCRKRRTPPSVRFLGRKVYAGVWVVLVAAMSHGLTGKRLARLREELKVDRRTLERWREWWQEVMPQTSFWKAARGLFSQPVDAAQMPCSLIEEFGAKTHKGMLNLLKFLLPLTVGWAEVGMDF